MAPGIERGVLIHVVGVYVLVFDRKGLAAQLPQVADEIAELLARVDSCASSTDLLREAGYGGSEILTRERVEAQMRRQWNRRRYLKRACKSFSVIFRESSNC